MHIMETSVAAKKYQGIFPTTSDREFHARKVMESYQTWFGEGPELSVLRMLGLFDRPADEKALEALLKPPAIPGLTESLTDLRPDGVANDSCQIKKSKTSSPEKIRTIRGISIRILLFGNTLANSFGVNEPRLGRNAIGGSFTIIERLRRSCRIISGRWSRFSWP